MPKTYYYNGLEVSKDRVKTAAFNSGLSVDDYLAKHDGFETRGEDITAWQSLKNNLANAAEMGGDVLEFYGIGTGDKNLEELADEGELGAYSGLNIASTMIWEGVFGREKMKEWKEKSPGFFNTYNPSDSKTFKKVIENFAEEKKETKETMSFKEADSLGDYMSVALGAVANVGGSVAYNLGTAGTGFFMDFASDNFIEANKIKAESQGITLDELLKNNDADIATPVKIAAVQAGLEYFALGKVTKGVVGKDVTKDVGKNLARKYMFSKSTRVGLDVAATGSVEALTEMTQYGLEYYNKKLAEAKGKGEDISMVSTIAEGMFSEEGIENGLQGFFGGAGLRGGMRSAKAMGHVRKTVSDTDVEAELSNLVNLKRKYNESKDPDVRAGLDAKIIQSQININDKVRKGNSIFESLSDNDISNIESLGDLADVTAYRATQLNKKLAKGEISNQDHMVALDGLTTKFKEHRNKIQTVINNATVRQQADILAKETGKEGKVSEMTSEEIAGIKEEGFDSKQASKEFGFIKQNTDGSFEIILNKDKPMEGTAAHEFMHAVLFRTIGNDKKIQDSLGDALVAHTSKLGGDTSVLGERLEAYGKWQKTKDGKTEFVRDANFGEETITIMSESILDGSLKFEENFFTKIGDAVRRFSQEYLGKEFKFNTGRDVYNFVKDYSKSIKEGKVNKAILKAAKEGIKGKLVEGEAAPKAAVQMSKEASNKVQSIYESLGVAGAMDIIDQFKPIVNRIVDRRRDAPGFDRELLTSEIELGQRGVLDLIKEYKPESGVPLAAYINKFLPSRAIEASRRILGEEFTEDIEGRVDIAAEEVAVEVAKKPKKKKILLSDRLGVKNKVDAAVAKALPKLDIEKLNFKNLKDLTPKITGELFGISSKKLISGANITKKELQSAQMFINKNADVLLAMLPNGATVSGTSTGVQKVLLNSFYNKTDRAKMAKTGAKSGLAMQVKKPNITNKQFLEVFGIIDGKPVRDDRNTSSRVLALANQTGKMMSNQAVRQELINQGKPLQALQNIADGKATIMFRKSEQRIGAIDRSLDESVRPLLWDGMMEFANENILDRNLESIKIGLTNVYGNIPSINNKIDDLATAIHKVVKKLKDPVIKNPVKLTEKLLLTNDNQNLKVRDFFNSELTAAAAFRDKARVKANIGTIRVLSNKIFNARNPEKSIAKILMMKGHLASSSKAKHLDRKQPFPGTKVFLENTLGVIPGIKYKTKKSTDGKISIDKNSITYNGKAVKIENVMSSQTSKTALNEIKNKDKLAKRSKNEDIAGELLNDIVGFYSNLFKEGEIDNVDLTMVSASLLSNMSSVLARAAKLKYVSKNASKFKNPGKELKYEHMQPRVAVLLNMFDTHINGDGIANPKSFLKNYNVAIIPNTMDRAVTEAGFAESLYPGQTLDMESWIRYFNDKTMGDKRLVSLIDVNTNKELKSSEAFVRANEILTDQVKENKVLGDAMQFSKSTKNPAKGISVLDFDDTLATTESLVQFKAPDGTTGTLNAEQYASTYQDLLEQGYKFDFSDFNKVVKAKLAPLFNKALKLQKKFGPENMFILTARRPAAQKAIRDFLKANGLNIPLKNITGLGNSTAEAKALWVADKVGEGYNDFYFADDALQNVQAVKNMLDQFDVKSKIQQARVKFSKDVSTEFNKILEESKGIAADKRFSEAKARKRGAKKGKYRFFIPPSADDLTGLYYNFLGKGKQGEAHMKFFKQALIDPLNRAYRDLNAAKQSIANDYKALKEKFPEIRNKLTKKTPDGDFNYGDATRVYLWDKAGFEIPGLSKVDQAELVDLVKQDPELQAYADTIGLISKQKEGYVPPGEYWLTEDIRVDLENATGKIGRKEFFKEWQENADTVFSKENLNKIEAIYGGNFRDALEDILYRTKNGSNRNFGNNRIVNNFMNWINGSIGATMFFNARSAVLQTLSTVNFINWGDNNVFKAAGAFANQGQYWKDFSYIFNSDMLKQRRTGLKQDVNAAELTSYVSRSKEPAKAAINWLLQKGFLPTQIADSFAIAAGGATMYRNRIKTYTKQGMSKKDAEAKAWTDFSETAEATQQSARPDMISQQQASVLGRLILAFQNTPMQYMRLVKKSMMDLVAGRGDAKTHVSKIIYYGAVQNLIFYGLQSALFAMMFGDDDDEKEEFFKKKQDRIANSMIDGILRGIGVGGAIVSTLKNMAIKFAEQEDKKFNKDESAVLMEMLNVSPPIGIKARKLVSAQKTYQYNKKVINEMELADIDNPAWQSVGNVVESVTNVPLARMHNKTMNLREALNQENEAWQRIAMLLGWNRWDVGVKNQDVEEIKDQLKNQKTYKRKKSKLKGKKKKIIL